MVSLTNQRSQSFAGGDSPTHNNARAPSFDDPLIVFVQSYLFYFNDTSFSGNLHCIVWTAMPGCESRPYRSPFYLVTIEPMPNKFLRQRLF
jgi:hypothetical protein